VHYPGPPGRLMKFVGALERANWQIESWNVKGTRDEIQADFRGWHEDIQSFVAEIETPYKWALMVRAPLEHWTVGRVTLLGDAAHSMLPFLAQGAIMAIEDGYLLARCLSQFGVEEALQRYERARIDRTRRTVEGSAANIHRFHNPVLADPEEGRKFIDREWANQRIADRYEWLFRYDATTVEI
jgi:salicylate hydroxylase